MKTLLLLVSILLMCLIAQAAPINDAAYLYKISRHLRGLNPTAQEYAQLQLAQTKKTTSAYFKSKIAEYMKTSQYVDGMNFRLDELFEIQTPSLSSAQCQALAPSDRYSSGSCGTNALDDLFRNMVQQNLSWDTLLTDKSYRITSSGVTTDPSSQSLDFAFFKMLRPDLPAQNTGVVDSSLEQQFDSGKQGYFAQTGNSPPIQKDITFDQDDPRIAGALTTARFFSRYTNVAINKDRRRAAAIFRVFLCDPMVPAIVNGNDKTHELLDVSFGKDYQVSLEDIQKQISTNAQRHGTDAACFSCHFKLDPMGMTFQNSGVVLSPFASKGALVFKQEDGSVVNIPGRGIGDVAKAITQQPKYQSCQVQTLWNWFVGTDALLTDTRKQELTSQFNNMDRKVNSFVSYILAQPEFREAPSAKNYVTFSQVKPLLQKCDNCHGQMADVPTFATYPLGGNDQTMKEWLPKMNDRLGRSSSDSDRMPQDWKNWKDADIELIKTWISNGARND